MGSTLRIAVCLPLLLSACSRLDNAVTSESQQIKDRLSAAEKRIAAAERADAAQDLRLESVEVGLGQKADSSAPAYVSIADKAYGTAHTPHGPLFITVEDVQPYANGQRLALTIGNPTMATFNGATLKIRHGESLLKSQEKTVSITDVIRSGTWNKVNVVLAPATAAQLEYLSVEVSFSQLSLRR